MPIPDGLALWLAYMQRVATFIDSGDVDAACVRYTALLDDWRSVVRRIGRRLDVPLAADERADEVDGFSMPQCASTGRRKRSSSRILRVGPGTRFVRCIGNSSSAPTVTPMTRTRCHSAKPVQTASRRRSRSCVSGFGRRLRGDIVQAS